MIRSNQDHNALSMDEKVAAACRDVGQQVIEVAERTGTEIVIWRDGKIVRLTAADARAEFNQNQSRSSEAGGQAPNFTELWISIDDKKDYDKTVAQVQETVDGYPGLYRDLLTYLREANPNTAPMPKIDR